MPKVTIIIPIYNAEEYIKKCLDSIIDQTFKSLQVILVNDGSTDSSEQIIDKYIAKYPNVFEKINKENGGQATARNMGIKYAKGEYVIFIDSDDYIDPTMIEELYNEAYKNNADIAVCDYYEIKDGEKKIYRNALVNYSNDNIINYALSNSSPWNKLVKLDLIKNNNITFLENYIYEDLATMPLLCGYAKKIEHVKKPLHNYIIRTGSTMRQEKYNTKLDSIFVVIDYLERQFNERNLMTRFSSELEFLVIYHLLYAGSGRFLEYEEGKPKLKKIKEIIKSKYPRWYKNKYYKKQSVLFKITCDIFYSNNPVLINLYLLARKKIKK